MEVKPTCRPAKVPFISDESDTAIGNMDGGCEEKRGEAWTNTKGSKIAMLVKCGSIK